MIPYKAPSLLRRFIPRRTGNGTGDGDGGNSTGNGHGYGAGRSPSLRGYKGDSGSLLSIFGYRSVSPAPDQETYLDFTLLDP